MSDEFTPIEQTPEQQPPTRRSAAWGRLKRFLIKLAIIAAVGFSFPYILPYFYNPQKNAPIAAGATEHAETTPQVVVTPEPAKVSEPAPEPVLAPVQTNGANDERIEKLEGTIKDLQQSVADLQQKITALSSQNNRQVAAISALSQIKDALSHGEGFRASWNHLSLAAVDNKEVQEQLIKLADYADNGVATLDQLQTRFTAIIPSVLSPSSKPGTFSASLQSLIRIRKVGAAQEGNDAEAIIARAEAKLKSGALAESLKELDTLPPEAAAALKPWRDDAEKRQRALAIIASIQALLIQPEASEKP